MINNLFKIKIVMSTQKYNKSIKKLQIKKVFKIRNQKFKMKIIIYKILNKKVNGFLKTPLRLLKIELTYKMKIIKLSNLMKLLINKFKNKIEIFKKKKKKT